MDQKWYSCEILMLQHYSLSVDTGAKRVPLLLTLLQKRASSGLQGKKPPVKWAVVQAAFEEAYTIREIPLDAPKPVTPTAWKHGWDGTLTTPLES